MTTTTKKAQRKATATVQIGIKNGNAYATITPSNTMHHRELRALTYELVARTERALMTLGSRACVSVEAGDYMATITVETLRGSDVEADEAAAALVSARG